MAQALDNPACNDPIWHAVYDAAITVANEEPVLSGIVHASVINQPGFDDAVSYILAQKLGTADMPSTQLRPTFDSILAAEQEIGAAARADLVAVCDRDPTCRSPFEVLLFFKGYHSIQAYRLAHALLKGGRRALALYLQSRAAAAFAVDINPGARLGCGIMIDHGTGVVIGETAVVADGVSILQGVTLGGTGKEAGDRHPKIGEGVMIGAGARVLGNITIGACAKIGAGSVVLHDVPAGCTAAGVPARILAKRVDRVPAREMDQSFD
jgi:serine O-acetyltransferase